MEAELQRLRHEGENDVKKFQDQMDTDVHTMEETMRKQIENEVAHLRNQFEIECGKLREEVEKKIEEINKNRYKGLTMAQDVNALPEHKDIMDKNRVALDAEISKEIEDFKRETQERQARFDTQLKILLEAQERRDIDFLKKAALPVVQAEGIKHLADESILESRHQIKITRSAVRTGGWWALYKATYKGKAVLCRVTVLNKVPIQIKKNYESSAKCMRFLGQTQNEHFLAMYDIFSTDAKVYCFLEEYTPTNLGDLLLKSKVDGDSILKWTKQIAQALSFMHRYAIAHLNVRDENVIVGDQGNVKVVGLTQTFFYFNLDMEAMRKAPKMIKLPVVTDHLPDECFHADFAPRPADSYSLGLLVYEMYVSMASAAESLALKRKTLSKIKTKEAKSHLELEKITNADMRSLVEKLLCDVPLARPRFDEVIKHIEEGGAGGGKSKSNSKSA